MVRVFVILAFVMTGSMQHCGADESDTQDKKNRIQRTLKYGNEVFEQLQLPDKPEITVVINYMKGSAKPMPVMLNWFSRRDRKIAELTYKTFDG